MIINFDAVPQLKKDQFCINTILFATGTVLDDFLELNLENMFVRDLTEAISNPAGARFAHGLISCNNRLWMVSGILDYSGVTLTVPRDSNALDLFLFLYAPRDVSWPINGQISGFVSVFDWDTVFVDKIQNMTANLSFCVNIMPCFMSIRGISDGILETAGQASISCLRDNGCTGLEIESLIFFCDKNTEYYQSLFIFQGTYLIMQSVSVAGCLAQSDGSAIRAYDNSLVLLYKSDFAKFHSVGLGGAVSVSGSTLQIQYSSFYNCSSVNGGGAIGALPYLCYGSTSPIQTKLYIESSSFINCASQGRGGALTALSESSIPSSQYELGEAMSIWLNA